MASSFTGYADTFPVVCASVTHYDCRGRYLSNYQCCTSVLEWPRFVHHTITASLVVNHWIILYIHTCTLWAYMHLFISDLESRRVHNTLLFWSGCTSLCVVTCVCVLLQEWTSAHQKPLPPATASSLHCHPSKPQICHCRTAILQQKPNWRVQSSLEEVVHIQLVVLPQPSLPSLSAWGTSTEEVQTLLNFVLEA